jgi:hypothetical protein
VPIDPVLLSPWQPLTPASALVADPAENEVHQHPRVFVVFVPEVEFV